MSYAPIANHMRGVCVGNVLLLCCVTNMVIKNMVILTVHAS